MAIRPTATTAANGVNKKRPSSPESTIPGPKRVKASVTAPKKSARKTRPTSLEPTLSKTSTSSSPLEIFVFGEGDSGELGLGTKNATGVRRPRLNKNLDAKLVGVVQVAVGGMHCIALTHDNKILTWGVNDNSALGRNTTWDGVLKDADDDESGSDDSESSLNPLESTPTAIPSHQFPEGIRFAQVTAGDSCSFALTVDGFVYGWGTFRDANGRFGFSLNGDNEIIEEQSTPMRIPNLKNITQISAGGDFALALDNRGNVFAWGSYLQGHLGRRVVERRRLEALLPHPVGFHGKVQIVSVHTGSDHAFAIDAKGDTWAWGSNNFAQTGIVDHAGEGGTFLVTPQIVPSLRNLQMSMIQGGSHHSIGLTQSGKCLVWGRIDGGQAGLDLKTLPLDDDTKVLVDERSRPRILLAPTPLPIPTCVFVAAGSDHNLAVTREGKVYTWGFNTCYQCGQGDGDDIAVATILDNNAARGKTFVWAGAGGQFSMIAARAENSILPNGKLLTNGTRKV